LGEGRCSVEGVDDVVSKHLLASLDELGEVLWFVQTLVSRNVVTVVVLVTPRRNPFIERLGPFDWFSSINWRLAT